MVTVISYMYRTVEITYSFSLPGEAQNTASSNKQRVALFPSSSKLGFVYDLKGGAECELLTFSLIWL